MPTPESRQKRAESCRAAWADPAKRAARMEGIKRAWEDPENRGKMSTSLKARLADPAAKKKLYGHRALPEMTGEQHTLYIRLRPLVGRQAALAEVFRPTGRKPSTPCCSTSEEQAPCPTTSSAT